MKLALLEFVRCPIDLETLDLLDVGSDGGEVQRGSLVCSGGHRYPISAGVPRLLKPEPPSEAVRQTRESFEAKWRRVPDYGHEPASRDFAVRWYVERFGFGDLAGLAALLAERRLVLDAGTGLGRDAALYAAHTRGQIFAVDVSGSVERAYQQVGHLPNVHVIQADLHGLPFLPGLFDYVASDQVIHHTPDTATAFHSLAGQVAPGGQLAVYVYKRKALLRELADDALREHCTALPEESCYAFARQITLLGKSLSDLNVDLDLPEDIPLLGLKAGRHNLQRFIYWHFLKCFWNDALDFETNVIVNFDWYHPRYAHRHTPDEVRRWCAAAGLEIVHFNVDDSGISVRAQRPAGRSAP